MSSMNYQWLKTFITSAETLNFRQASEKLMLSQPSVSVHIRMLEEQLGMKLFERINNSVKLTDAGKVFYTKAVKLVDNWEKSISQMHSYVQGYRSQWTVAISPLMAETILPYILRTFMDQQPEVEITIRVEDSEQIEHMLDRGEAHIGISAVNARIKDIESIPINEEPVVFVMPNDVYDEESGPHIDVRDTLMNHYLLTHHHPTYWDDLLLKLQQTVTGIRTMKVTQAHIAKRFVQEGLGVSFLPHSIVRRELLEGRLMNPHFNLFELPTVSTFVHVKQKGELEEAFIKEISGYYFG